MSAFTIDPRREGGEIFFLHIDNLPKGYTWKDLKDLIRTEASHGIWTEVAIDHTGQRAGRGFARVQRRDEAHRLFAFLTKNTFEKRRLNVHLWDISNAPPRFIHCNCAPNSRAHGPGFHAQEIAARIGSQTSNIVSMTDYPAVANISTFHAQNRQTMQMMPQLASATTEPQLSFPSSSDAIHSLQTWEARQHAHQAVQHEQTPSQWHSFAPPQSMYLANSTGAPVNAAYGVVKTEARGIFVSNLCYKVRTRDIKEFFGAAGEIRKIDLHRDNKTGRSKGCATIKYAKQEGATRAVQMFHRREFMSMALNVRADRERSAVTPPRSPTKPEQSSSPDPSQPTIVDGTARHYD